MKINSTSIDGVGVGVEKRTSSVRWALVSLSLAMLLSSLDTSIANVALPTLAQEFTASFQEVQWIVLAYLLTITTVIVSVGRFGDIIGRRRLLLAGIFLFTVTSLLGGLAPTLWLLIAARAVQGLGGATMMALAMALVSETVPKAKTGSAMGLLGTMSAIGTALGPSLGGVLIAGLGWRAIFFVNVPMGILTFLLAYRYLPADCREPGTARPGFDIVGTLLLATTLAAYALAVTIGRGSFGSINMALLVAAAIGVGLFVLAEAKAASPLIRLAMFRDAVLSASLAMSALVSTVVVTTLVVGPFYLSLTLGLDAAMVGLVLVGRSACRRANGRTSRSNCRPFWRTTPDHCWPRRHGGRLLSLIHHASDVRHLRLHCPNRRHHRWLWSIPDRQQHRRNDRSPPRSARGHFRNAQFIAQSRPHHRCIRYGGSVRARNGDDRHYSGEFRGHCHRHADHVRGRDNSDCCRARHRGWKSYAGHPPFVSWRRVSHLCDRIYLSITSSQPPPRAR